MATRKKIAPALEVPAIEETRPAAEPTRARVKPTTAKKATATSAAGKPAQAKTAAATHKAPARKKALAAAPVATETIETRPPSVAFDPAEHHEEIGHAAYAIWENNGRPHGSANADWQAAIEVVRSRYEE